MMFLCFFFFFKQKTAYEMRISDWSSDVCSSDLNGRRAQRQWRRQVHQWRDQGRQPRAIDAQRLHRARHRLADGRHSGYGLFRNGRHLDRKSVVKGKSVSVRVDFGGRRIITKKNKLKKKIINT